MKKAALLALLPSGYALYGQTCTFSVSPATLAVSAEETTGVIQITASASNCARTASTSVPWITISFGSPGTGNGTVGYRVQPNRDPAPRTGSIVVAGITIPVTQAAAACTFTLAPNASSIPVGGGFGSFTVTTTCNWTAQPSADWIQVTSAASGTGNSTIAYSVSANSTGAPRTGSIRVGSATFQIAQQGPTCTFTFNPPRASFSAAAGTGRIEVTSNCAWTATTTQTWITLSPPVSATGNGVVSYAVAENRTGQARSGAINIGGQTFAITQAAADCTLDLDPPSVTLPAAAANGSVAVRTDCPWTATPSDAWITILAGGAQDRSGTLFYSVAANPSETSRTGSIRIGSRTFAITQLGAVPVPRFTAGGIANAASFAPGLLSPNLIFTVFGSALGPAGLVVAPGGAAFPQELGGTRVLIDGQAVPLIYVSNGQLAGSAPAALAGREQVTVEVVTAAGRSAAVRVPVAPVAPGLFTQDASGLGPGAILNQDFSLNTAANPAARGSVIQIFSTGAGLLEPPVPDGALAGLPLARVVAPVQVEIGGEPAEVLYAGVSPGLIGTLVQINALVGERVAPAPAVPVRVIVAGVASQAGVTVAVK